MKIVLYTHSDVKYVWPIFFGQTKKWLSKYEKAVFVDRDDSIIPNDYQRIIYNDKKTYKKRLLHCLKNVDSELILFQHEDMFLYDRPDLDRIDMYADYLLHTDRAFIKLIRGGNQTGIPDIEHPELKKIDSHFDYIFVVQPAIWKTKKLIEILKYSSGNTIWELEREAQKTCRARKIFGYYVDDNGAQRGRSHWDSAVYPYIATAVVKGRWNINEYPLELTKIIKQYDKGSNI